MMKYERVPLTPEEDLNPQATTWLDGKCVKLDEGRFVTYYAGHHEEEIQETKMTEQGETFQTVTVCMAVPVRIEKGCPSTALLTASPSVDIYSEVLPLYVADNMEIYRGEKTEAALAYDKSPLVNEFTYKGIPMWLSREDRIVIKDRFEREKVAGLLLTHLVYRGYDINVSPDEGLQLINAISTYADLCFDCTQTHLAAIRDITDAATLIAYDHTSGYPEKLAL